LSGLGSTRVVRSCRPAQEWGDERGSGRTIGLAHDEADRAAGNRIGCPLLALWGQSAIPNETRSPLDTWREWANDVQGAAIDCRHYLPEGNPQATAAALLAFFAGC
jgi:haloacetate dehalogenase